MAEFDEQVDATGLNCPMPILRAKKALNGLHTGQRLQVIATDPGSVRDFEAFARQTGHALEQSAEDNGTFRFLIRKA
ncbi:sulfurtransferase TusA family protein [Granulosicoccaceae sp. 1_MG-2023]|nr:sulfurtransferase TusA family protein [Granulosicoccaceae sp. 1_MG-2023]